MKPSPASERLKNHLSTMNYLPPQIRPRHNSFDNQIGKESKSTQTFITCVDGEVFYYEH